MEPPIKLIDNILWHIPFIGLMVNSDHSPIITRLIEAVIIGGVVMYGTVKVLGARVDHVSARLDRVQVEIQHMRRDLYQPRAQDDFQSEPGYPAR